MLAIDKVFPPQRSSSWTKERVDRLSKQEIQSLRANADSLGAAEVIALCDAALLGSPRSGNGKAGAPVKNAKTRRLVSRINAFGARGVHLHDTRASWGGVRKSDRMVVMSLWADAVESRDGGCGYLLWAPNVDGSRPWSDTPSGRERLKHCQLGLERDRVEGLLVAGLWRKPRRPPARRQGAQRAWRRSGDRAAVQGREARGGVLGGVGEEASLDRE